MEVDANIFPDNVNGNNSAFSLEQKALTHFVKLPKEIIPTEDWQSFQVNLFSKLRMKISHYRSMVENGQVKLVKEHASFKKNHQWWIEYMFGNQPMSTSSSEEEANSSNEDADKKSAEETKRNIKVPHVPKPSELLVLTQGDLFDILQYFDKLMGKGMYLSEHLAQWIYAILSLLEKPLTSDILSTMRSISRKSSQIRYRTLTSFMASEGYADMQKLASIFSNLYTLEVLESCTPDKPTQDSIPAEIQSTTLIIYVIGHYFGQKDLLD